jgi:hypothetical protein
MNRIRIVLGYLVAAMLIFSSGAHSFLGWKQLAADLAKIQAPAELVTGLAIGWYFGGAAMLILGIIVLLLFRAFQQRRAVSLLPALVIAVVYLSFGLWALVASGYNPFFMVFIIPGILLFAASWGSTAVVKSTRPDSQSI